MLMSVLLEVAEPNMAKLTIKGPIVVPRLFIPPAIVRRCDPVVMGPRAIANGFATVCCSENPSATMNKPDNIRGNDPVFAAG